MKTALTDSQIESYQENGCLVYRGLLSEFEVKELLDSISSAVEILGAVGGLLQDRYTLKGITQEQPAREVPSRSGGLIDALGELLDDLAHRVDVVVTSTGD